MKHAKSLIPAILAVSVMTGAPALMTEPAYAAEASQSAVAEQQPVAANNGVHTFLSNVDAIDHEIAALKDFQKKDSTALTEKDQNAANQKLTYLRKVKARDAETLCLAIGQAMSSVSPTDIRNWFASCGYSLI